MHESVTTETSIEGVSSNSISGFVDRLFGLIDKFFDKLGEVGKREGEEMKFAIIHNSIKDDKEAYAQMEQAGTNANKIPDQYVLLVNVKFTGGEENIYDDFDVYAKLKGTDDSQGRVIKNNRVKYSNDSNDEERDEELMDAVGQAVEQLTNEFFPNAKSKGVLKTLPIRSSIELTLKKIIANDEIDVQLVSINSSLDIPQTNQAINDILDSQDFIDSLPELTPTSYSIDVLDDDYDVNPCENCCVDLSACILKILDPLYQLYFDSMYLTWNATGANYQTIVNLADSYHYLAHNLIDLLSVEHFKEFNYAPHPSTFAVNSVVPMDTNAPIEILQHDIQNIMDAIDLYYCNFDGAIQEELLTAKDQLDTELNYTLARF